jgi:hypothetical protein
MMGTVRLLTVLALAAIAALASTRAEAAECNELRLAYSGPAGKMSCMVDTNTGDADARATTETIVVERPGSVLLIVFVYAGVRTYIDRADLRSSLSRVKELGLIADWAAAPSAHGFQAQRFKADFGAGVPRPCFGFLKQEGVPFGAPGLGVARQLLGFYCAAGSAPIPDAEVEALLAAIRY